MSYSTAARLARKAEQPFPVGRVTPPVLTIFDDSRWDVVPGDLLAFDVLVIGRSPLESKKSMTVASAPLLTEAANPPSKNRRV